MIIESTMTNEIFLGLILLVGLFGINIGGIVSSIFGKSSTKTDSSAKYETFLQKQEQNQRDFEQRMLLLQAQQKKSGLSISPIMMIGGVAVVAMVFLPKMMGR